MNRNEELICKKMASPFGVSPKIHPEDFIFRFLLTHERFKNFEEAAYMYFSDGNNSALVFKSLLSEICNLDNKKPKVLEFASGFGCVTRHLTHILKDSSITACDIHPAAIDFTKKELGVECILSNSRPEDLDLKENFDVVFALSFFSHMPKISFNRWLQTLSSLLKSNGHIIFTTHGLVSLKLLFSEFSLGEDGYLFLRSSEQKDLDTDEYGSAVVSPKYVFKTIEGIDDLSIIYFREAYWWTHQDCFVVKKGNAN